MPQLPLLIGKIATTPQANLWSQTYNAGGLFAVLSLSKDAEKPTEDVLNTIGKDMFNTLEEEYFTLETKDFESIKQAISTTQEKIPSSVSFNLAVAVLPSLTKNHLYVFATNGAKIFMKRGDQLGILLHTTENQSLASASGFLENNDILFLASEKLGEKCSKDLLSDLAKKEPQEGGEHLSEKLQDEPEAGGFILRYKNPQYDNVIKQTTPKIEEQPQEKIPTDTNTYEEDLVLQKEKPRFSLPKLFKLPHFSFTFLSPRRIIFSPLSHKQKLFLSLGVLLCIVFITSIFFAIQKQEEVKVQQAFQETITTAQKKYDEGQALLNLNRNLAKDDLLSAQKIIKEKQSLFQGSPKEKQQLDELLKKIDEALLSAAQVNAVQATMVDESKSTILKIAKNKSVPYLVEDKKVIYYATNDGIYEINKKTDKEKTIAKNKSDWQSLGGFGTYLGNFYLLDKTSGKIIKLVPSGSSFRLGSYLKNKEDEVINGTSMAIDGSIWILMTNGDIKKFTKGIQDTLTITGLDTPLNNPTQIFTNNDINIVYILDKGNNRIVVLNKNGSYQEQYQTEVVKDTITFDVQEKDKKIYLLSKDKIYQIEIK